MHAKPSSDPFEVPAAPGADPVPRTWSRFRYPQSLYKYGAVLGTLAFIAWTLEYLNIPLERLPGMLGRMSDTLSRRYYPPNIEHVLRPEYMQSLFETLQMSYLATILGLALAVPLAWGASINMTPSRRFVYPVCRLIIMACRSVHEMIWTIIAVTILGFGLLPGTVALTLFCIGFAGKLFAEAIEAIRPGQVEAIRASGASLFQVFVYAVLPQVRVAWTGTSIYTWDVVFRAATVVGFFGAGGMGHYLRESVQKVESRQVSAIILTIVVIVIVAELFSAWARARIAKAVA